MSPEQVRGDAVDARADLFALGVVLHEALAGRRPFEGASAFAVLHAILHEEPEPLAALRPEAPAPLARLVRRCLAKDAERRAQTAKEVRNELDEIARELELAPARRGEGERPPGNPVARSLPLTASHVRHLSVRNPRLVGHPLTWSDNGVGSDVLLVLLHGIGSDDGPFEPVLRASPWRTVAPTLVGFAREEAQRPALGIDDHSRLLRVLLRELVAELEPATTILVGHSAGADQFLRMIHDEAGGGAGIEVDGLLALGPNVDLGTCFASRHYASLDAARPEGTLALLKTLGAGIESLSTWLVVHAYFASTFMKLGEELEPLRRYAIDLVAPFERPGDPLALWYRTARRRVPHLRLVFSNEESAAAEALLGRHLESNVLGDDFVESSFVFEPVHHLGLLEPERLLGHVEALLGGARGR
jgi:pimeloyl-ACP methyl ester carboxylesterase